MIQLKAMWEPGSSVVSRQTDAQKVADEIYGISDTPTADEIISMASNPDTESYKLFDWDDAVAGPKWRRVQARYVMHALKVEFVNDSEEKAEPTKVMEPVRMFYGNPNPDEDGFVSIVKVMGNRDTYEQLLERAKTELKWFKKKYSILTELEAIFEMIDSL